MTLGDLVKVTVFVTRHEHVARWREIRDSTTWACHDNSAIASRRGDDDEGQAMVVICGD
jgi:hypothetical protein